MADIAAVFERLKSNKYALPALAIGTIAGGYVLLKRGGIGGGGGISGIDQANAAIEKAEAAAAAAAQGQGGEAGGGGNDVTGELLAQQQGFMQSVTNYLNEFAAQVQGAISGQAAQTQDAINAVVGQQQGYLDAIQQQLGLQAQAYGGQAYQQPDFSSLYQAIASIPQLVGQAAAPQLQNLIPQNVINAVRAPINYSQITGALGGKVITSRSPNLSGLGINLKPGVSLGYASGYKPLGQPTQGGSIGGLVKPAARPVLPTLLPYPKQPPLAGGGGTVARK